jgi:hypothetical protein
MDNQLKPLIIFPHGHIVQPEHPISTTFFLPKGINCLANTATFTLVDGSGKKLDKRDADFIAKDHREGFFILDMPFPPDLIKPGLYKLFIAVKCLADSDSENSDSPETVVLTSMGATFEITSPEEWDLMRESGASEFSVFSQLIENRRERTEERFFQNEVFLGEMIFPSVDLVTTYPTYHWTPMKECFFYKVVISRADGSRHYAFTDDCKLFGTRCCPGKTNWYIEGYGRGGELVGFSPSEYFEAANLNDFNFFHLCGDNQISQTKI